MADDTQTKRGLAAEVAHRREIPRAVAQRIVDRVLETMKDGLADGKRVELRGLGTFRPRHYPGYKGRNPRTDEAVEVAPKVLVAFRMAKGLHRRLNDDD